MNSKVAEGIGKSVFTISCDEDELIERLSARTSALIIAHFEGKRLVTDAGPEPSGLLRKSGLARALSISTSTVDRLVREGLPYEPAGSGKRFDLKACRVWLAARGKRPTTAPRRAAADDIDVSDVAAAAGLVARGAQ